MRMVNWEGILRGVEEVRWFVRELRGSEAKRTADTTSLAYPLVDDIETRNLLTPRRKGMLHKRAGAQDPTY